MMILTGSSERFSLSKIYWCVAVVTSVMSLILASFSGSVTKSVAFHSSHVKLKPFSGW